MTRAHILSLAAIAAVSFAFSMPAVWTVFALCAVCLHGLRASAVQ